MFDLKPTIPIPQTFTVWLYEIVGAYLDALNMVGDFNLDDEGEEDPLESGSFLLLAPALCLNRRGIILQREQLEDLTQICLRQCREEAKAQPLRYSTSELSFANTYLTAHRLCQFIDSDWINLFFTFWILHFKQIIEAVNYQTQGPYVDAAKRKAIQQDYVLLRDRRLVLNQKLNAQLTQRDFHQGLKLFDMINKQGVIVVNDPDKLLIVNDYSLYSVFHDGQNTIDRAREDTTGRYEPHEHEMLDALSKSWYTVFITGVTAPDVGVYVYDLLYKQWHLLADQSLSRSMHGGVMFAGRLMPYNDYHVSTGAVLPVLPVVQKRIETILDEAQASPPQRIARKREAQLSNQIIRLLFHHGCNTHVGYALPGESIEKIKQSKSAMPFENDLEFHPTDSPKVGPKKVGRNDPCPCGSGKKYKKCCG